jgi:hypothetical protein
MLDKINGLPAHVLLIHVLVVLGPLGALFTILSAVWPRARRKLGVIGPITCAIVLVFTPITQSAGEWFDSKLQQNGKNAAIAKHADLGHTFLWFAIALFIVSTAVWWLGRMTDATARLRQEAGPDSAGGPDSSGGPSPANARPRGGTATLLRPEAVAARVRLPAWVAEAVSALAVVVSVLVVWQLYRIGDSGAHAAWDYVQNLK